VYRICLVNLPFISLAVPSIALTQLKSVIQSQFQGKVSVEIVYVSHDFGKHIGVDLYQYFADSMEALYAGLGDWFFRQEAFPELPDNTEKYLRRYFWRKTERAQQVKNLIAQKRPKLNVYMDELITKYQLDKADIVGFTSMFMQNVAAFAFARKLKQRNPTLITVLGGANCEFPMGKVIAERVSDIDFVFSGPALKNFPEFVQHCLDGNVSNCHSIRGVFSKNIESSQSDTKVIGDELSIDIPIELDYEDFMLRFDECCAGTKLEPSVMFETSRGCWWGQRAHCTFCGLNGESMAYRAMKPDIAIQQFRSLFRYSDSARLMVAVDNILPKSYLQQVLPFIEPPPDTEIFYEVKADLSEQDVAVLAKARVMRIQPGIESLATSTLKLMKKGTTAFQNINLLKNCASYGITPYWNILVGFPGEKAEVYQRYLEILPPLAHLYPPSGVFPVRFDRFSPYHKGAQSYGLDLSPMDFYFMIYPFSEADLNDFAYYFSDQNLLAEYFNTMTAWIHKLRVVVDQWKARWADPKQSEPPRLYFQGDTEIIYDSRSVSVTEHNVGKVGKALLEHLSKPAWIEELISTFSARYGDDVTHSIAMLKEKKLVFREGDRLLSLVLNGKASAERTKYLPIARQ
jgi:ribosomal peptide maturation radical SAM protein 1